MLCYLQHCVLSSISEAQQEGGCSLHSCIINQRGVVGGGFHLCHYVDNLYYLHDSGFSKAGAATGKLSRAEATRF
jgi:hypothetical protein